MRHLAFYLEHLKSIAKTPVAQPFSFSGVLQSLGIIWLSVIKSAPGIKKKVGSTSVNNMYFFGDYWEVSREKEMENCLYMKYTWRIFSWA